MLAAELRLRRPADFAATVRRGPGTARAARRTLVVHLAVAGARAAVAPPVVSRAGLVVSRAVGPAVVRTRVKRRLRHLLRERLPLLPAGSRVVVRALPAAAAASSRLLGEELDLALAGALDHLAGRYGRARSPRTSSARPS